MKHTASLSIGREMFLTLGSKVLMAVIGFGGIIIFARELGDVGLGKYRTVLAAAFILVQLSAGTGTAVKKRVSEVDTEAGGYLSVGLLIHLGFTVLGLLAFVLLRPFATRYFGTVELAIGVVAVIAALGLFNVSNDFYAGIGHPAMASWIDTVRSVLTLAFQLLFLWFNLEAFGLVLVCVVATFLSSLISLAAARVAPTVATAEALGRVYSFARWSIPNALLSNLYGNADVIVIRAIVGAGPVGVYTVAAQLVMPGALYASSITNALTVKSSGVSSIGGDVHDDLKNALSYSGLISIPIVFGALAIPNALVTTLFGDSFAGAPAFVLIAMSLFQLANVYRKPFEAVIAGTDRPNILFRVNVLLVGSYLLLAPALGLRYGFAGIMTATVIAGSIPLLVYQYIAHREFGGVVVTRPILDQIVAGAVMFLAVEAVTRYAIAITNWVWLFVVVGAGAGVYFLSLVAISGHFRTTLRHVLPWLPAPVESEA